VLVLIGASYLVLSALNFVGGNAPNQVANVPTSAPTPRPLPTAVPEPTGAPDAPLVAGDALAATVTPLGPVGAAAPTVAPTAALGAPIVAEVSIDAGADPGSWLDIRVDGQNVFRKVLGPGQTLQYQAQRDFYVRAGNAGAVSVVINGQKQCCTAGAGQGITFNWPPR
jgi:hypothetical protein